MPETTEILSAEAARCSASAARDAVEAERYAGCQAAIGYQFRDPQLLEAALTHASGANHRLASNERLEFLGDAILGGIICERLFERFPDFLEGELTKLKSVVVSRLTCAKYSREMGLGALSDSRQRNDHRPRCAHECAGRCL